MPQCDSYVYEKWVEENQDNPESKTSQKMDDYWKKYK